MHGEPCAGLGWQGLSPGLLQGHRVGQHSLPTHWGLNGLWSPLSLCPSLEPEALVLLSTLRGWSPGRLPLDLVLPPLRSATDSDCFMLLRG